MGVRPVACLRLARPFQPLLYSKVLRPLITFVVAPYPLFLVTIFAGLLFCGRVPQERWLLAMTARYLIPLLFLATLLPGAAAQSDEGEVSLGDFARAARTVDKPSKQPVIDNENLSQNLSELHPASDGTPVFSIRGGNKFDMSSPDGSCSLSFSANATALIADPIMNRELPPSELAKLDGPAVISNNMLEVSIYNGTGWNLTDVTIGLTVIRHNSEEAQSDSVRSARLVPATMRNVDDEPSENSANGEITAKRSDTTVLYHLRGLAEPLKTTTFREVMASALEPGTEWHWAIVQAKGSPPKPVTTLGISAQAVHLPMSALPELPQVEIRPPVSRLTRSTR